MTGLLLAGTSSDAGKSLVATGLCRALRRRGIDVAPFKAQNMSNNSMVCIDGAEIGRAQYLQAQAAEVTATSAMNPVLLKPGTDRRSFVVLRGEPAGVLEAGEYATGRRHLAESAFTAYRELASQHEMIICEGAGSPAEINLRAGEYVNLGLAREVGLPVVVVGDIDRGGVLASLFGTWAILDDADRAHLKGYVINKFRGDQSILDPGLVEITKRTGLINYGVLPFLANVWLDGEDTLEVGRWRRFRTTESDNDLKIAVVRLPRISNATDVDALAAEPGVQVVVTHDPQVCAGADLVVLPGSRSTLSDLAWLRDQGIAEVVIARHQQGLPVLGICGGYQMLATSIADEHIEAEQRAGTIPGLGILPVKVEFFAEKILGRPHGTWAGIPVSGYEIHHGRCLADTATETFLDGVVVGQSYGTLWHGAFECDEFRRAFLRTIAATIGKDWQPIPDAPGYAERREQMINTLAAGVEKYLDVTAMIELAKAGV